MMLNASTNANRKKHRDMQRCNHATEAVRGCIYSTINKQCVSTLMKLNKESDSTPEQKNKMGNLLKIADSSCDESKISFVTAQKSISKHVCNEYAHSQFTSLRLQTSIGEAIEDVENISTYVVNEKIINMTENLVATIQSSEFGIIFI